MWDPASNLPDHQLSATLRDLMTATGVRIRVGYPAWLRPLLQRGVVAITLGNRVYLDEEVAGRKTIDVEAILIHELTHVRQFQEQGLTRFLYLYFREYTELRASGLTPVEAYRNISFEIEAARAEVEALRNHSIEVEAAQH